MLPYLRPVLELGSRGYMPESLWVLTEVPGMVPHSAQGGNIGPEEETTKFHVPRVQFPKKQGGD